MNKKNKAYLSSKIELPEEKNDTRFVRVENTVLFFNDIFLNKFLVKQSAFPTENQDLAVKGYLDGILTGTVTLNIEARSITATSFGSILSSTVQSILQDMYDQALLKSGGTFKGPLDMGSFNVTVNLDPINNLDVVNKSYVDKFNVVNLVNPSVKTAGQYLQYNGSQWIAASLSSTSTTSGLVTIVDNLTSTSTTAVLSANQGYILKKKIDSIVGSVAFMGTYNPVTSSIDYLTEAGISIGYYSIGSDLPMLQNSTIGQYFIASVSGTTSVRAAIANTLFLQGDWIVSMGSYWDLLSKKISTELAENISTSAGYYRSSVLGNNVQSSLQTLDLVLKNKIKTPNTVLRNQYLQYNGTNWIASNLPIASTTVGGIVTLSDSLNSTSILTAATSNAINHVSNMTVDITGGVLSGILDMGAYPITITKAVVNDHEVTNKYYVDNSLGSTITKPAVSVQNQYLQYNGVNWVSAELPVASLTAEGVVQLSDDLTSNSTNVAAAASLISKKISNPGVKAQGQNLLYDGINWVAASLPLASTTVSGIVELEDSYTSNLTNVAATANSIRMLNLQKIDIPTVKVSGDYLKYDGTRWVAGSLPLASTVSFGIVALDDTGTSVSTTLAATASSVSKKITNPAGSLPFQYLQYDGTAWISANLPEATSTTAGVIQLDDSVTSISTVLVATANSVKLRSDLKISAPVAQIVNQYLKYDGAQWISSALPVGSTTNSGIVCIDDAGLSTAAASANFVSSKITNPSTKLINQYLKYDGSNWIASDLPVGTDSIAGIVLLDDSGTSASTTSVATVGSLNRMANNKINNPSLKIANQYLKYNGANWVSANIPSASTAIAGFVQLSDSIISSSNVTAATANSVKVVDDLKITRPLYSSESQYLQYDGSNWSSVNIQIATELTPGITRLDDTGTNTSRSIAATARSLSTKISDPLFKLNSQYLQYNGTDWIAVDLPQATITSLGIVQLDDTGVSTSLTLAVTARSVTQVFNSKITNPPIKSVYQYLQYNGSEWISVNLPAVSHTQAGLIQLNSTLTSFSTNLAATASCINQINIDKMNKTGGTLLGDLNMNGFGIISTTLPSSNFQIANKLYVDNSLSVLIKIPSVLSSNKYLQYNGVNWDCVDLPLASTTVAGIVSLENTFTSSSTVSALTASRGFYLNDLLSYFSDGISFMGTYDAEHSRIAYLTNIGSNKGIFTAGLDLPSNLTGTLGFYFIVSKPGVTSIASQIPGTFFKGGDWIVSNGTKWSKLDSDVTSVSASNVSFNNTYSGSTITAIAVQGSIEQLNAKLLTKIIQPISSSLGDVLSYVSGSWNSVSLPLASVSMLGIVKLEDTGTSTSLELAATPNSLSHVLSLNILNPSQKIKGQFIKYDGSNWIACSLNQATFIVPGIVQLDDTGASTSTTLAATANSLTRVQLSTISDPSIKLTSQYLMYNGTDWISAAMPICSTLQLGSVILDDNIHSTVVAASTVATANVVRQIAIDNILNPNTKTASNYLKYDGSQWIASNLVEGTTSVEGILQLENTGLSNSITLAATSSSVATKITKPLSASASQYLQYDGYVWINKNLSQASITAAGIVQLDDSGTSTSTTLAATANVVSQINSVKITKPTTVANSQYLQYDGVSWASANLPVASTSVAGIVQLDDSGTSTSTTLAATANSLYVVNAASISNPTTKLSSQYLKYDGTNWIAANLPVASTSISGIVQLDDSGISTSTTLAATANSLFATASLKIDNPSIKTSGQYLKYDGTNWISANLAVASSSVLGIVQLDDTGVSTSVTKAATANSVSQKITNPATKSSDQYLQYISSTWVSASLPAASTTVSGVVQLDDSGTSTSTTLAATANSLTVNLNSRITNPSTKSSGQYLNYDGMNWNASFIPAASTTVAGIVQLDNSGTSTSTTLAATAASLNTAASGRISNPTTKTIGQYLTYNGTQWVSGDLPLGSTTLAGVVELDDTGLSTSLSLAATANAVGTKISNPAVKSSGQYLYYNGSSWGGLALSTSTTTVVGLVTLEDTGTSTSTSLAATIRSANTKIIGPASPTSGQYLQYNGTDWVSVNLPVASTSVAGIVQLDNSGTSTSTTLAATAASLNTIKGSVISKPAGATSGQYLRYNGTAWVSVNLPAASTTVVGFTELEDTGTSTSTILAATIRSANTKIIAPASPVTGQYLKYSGTAWAAATLPAASTTVAGIVQLDDTGTSTSTTLAATANSVSFKIKNPSTKSSGQYLNYSGTAWSAVSLPAASTTVLGIVQLDNSSTSTSTTTAATANLVSNKIKAPLSSTSGQYLQYSGTAWVSVALPVASSTVFGIVQLNDSGTSTSTTLAATANSLTVAKSTKLQSTGTPTSGQYLKYSGTAWSGAALPVGSTIVAGLVQLDNTGTSTSTTLAATANSVSLKIANPSTKSTGQYLKYSGTAWAAATLPAASTTVAGIVQLDDTGTSTSTTLAATANSVSLKIANPSTKSTGQYLKYSGTAWVAASLPAASTTVAGIVQLDDTGTSTSTTLAATANSLKVAIAANIARPASPTSGQYLKYNGTSWSGAAFPVGSTTVAGVVQLDDSGTSTSTTLAATANSVGLKITNPSTKSSGQYLKYSGTAWVAASLPVASTTVAGLVQLNDTFGSTSTTTAATARLLSLYILEPANPVDSFYLNYNNNSWNCGTSNILSAQVNLYVHPDSIVSDGCGVGLYAANYGAMTTGTVGGNAFNVLCFNSWVNSTGGNENAIGFDTTSPAVYLFQGGYNATYWSSVKTIVVQIKYAITLAANISSPDAASGYSVPQALKMGSLVKLSGMVINTAALSSSVATTLLTLPAACNPISTSVFLSMVHDVPGFARLDMTSTGLKYNPVFNSVTDVRYGYLYGIAANKHISLSGITYYIG